MSENTIRNSPRRISRGCGATDVDVEIVTDPIERRDTLELVRTYYTILNPAVRKRIAEIVKSIATTRGGE